MISYFPAPMPDELLYSVLARRMRHLGSRSAAVSLHELFGRSDIVASFDLPGHLSLLAGKLDPALNLTVGRLIDERTLFPYYAAFQDESVREYVRVGMAGGKRPMHFKLGISTFAVPRLRALRFCPACLSDMRRDRGEGWWRRSHQLASAPLCLEHAEILRESRVVFGSAFRYSFLPVTADTCPDDAPRVLTQDIGPDKARLMEVVTASVRLLDAPACGSRADLLARYRADLLRAGFMPSLRKVDHARLAHAVSAHYGAAIGALTAEGAGFATWLKEIVRSHQRAFHPLHHVLLDGFLQRVDVSASPFGEGPWECRNPLSDHHGEAVVKRLDMHRVRNTKVGVFTCACGYAYTRCLHDDGRLGPPRYRLYGPMLAPALRELAVAGTALRSVAQAVGLEKRTVVREAELLGLSTAWTRRSDCAGPGVLGHARRVLVSRQRRRLPVRSPAPRSARRGDVSRRRTTPRLDWERIDRALISGLRHAAEKVLSERPPVRITMAELERRIGREQYIRRRANTLPLAHAEARRLCEGLQAFQRRRARYAIERLRPHGEPAPWEVMRAAGLDGRHMAMLREELAAGGPTGAREVVPGSTPCDRSVQRKG